MVELVLGGMFFCGWALVSSCCLVLCVGADCCGVVVVVLESSFVF